jgi:hypothetical protein
LAVEKMNPAMTMKRGIMAKCKQQFVEARREHELTEILDGDPGRDPGRHDGPRTLISWDRLVL